MNVDFLDIRHQLHVNVNVEFELCPVGGRNMNGRVEKKIKKMGNQRYIHKIIRK